MEARVFAPPVGTVSEKMLPERPAAARQASSTRIRARFTGPSGTCNARWSMKASNRSRREAAESDAPLWQSPEESMRSASTRQLKSIRVRTSKLARLPEKASAGFLHSDKSGQSRTAVRQRRSEERRVGKE